MPPHPKFKYGNRDFIVSALIHADRPDLADRVRTNQINPGRAARLAGLRPLHKPTPPAPRPRFVLAPPLPFDPAALIS